MSRKQSRRTQRALERELFGPGTKHLEPSARRQRAALRTSRPPLDQADQTAVCCAIGRLFRILSRPHRPGDVEQYEACRRVVLDIMEPVS